MYLGGAVGGTCGRGEGTSQENTGEYVVGSGKVVGDRHISRELKGNMFSSCITPAYLYDKCTNKFVHFVIHY